MIMDKKMGFTSLKESAVPTVPLVRPSYSEQTPSIEIRNLHASYGDKTVLREVSADIMNRQVTAIIGPSGCGKSTLLRCLNRLHETVPTAKSGGEIIFGGHSIMDRSVNPMDIRRRIGMVFQRPTPFPTMSIRDNVAAGLRVMKGSVKGRKADEIVEEALRRSGLWTEVRDRLKDSAIGLSGGQQQRLCIARAIATRPEVLLMDEPTASLDPISTQKIEDLIGELRKDMTVVIVTHNMQQAARVSDRTIFMLNGELVESGPTPIIFANPTDRRTEDYVTGRFG